MRIFLNYRHTDNAGFAGRLSDALEAQFGHGSVSRYLNNPEPDNVSERSVAQQLGAIDVVIVMIGPRWAEDVAPASGRDGLERTDDFVQMQIEAALAQNKPIIAVLVNGARMPDAHELPDSISAFAQCESMTLDDVTWSTDVARLIARLRPSVPALASPTSTKAPLGPDSSPAWLITGGLLAVLFVLGAFLLTSRFWLDEPPAVVGTWIADVTYGDGATQRERFEFRLTGGELSGTASYRGMRRVIESGQLDGDEISFVIRTRERRGHEQIELRHAYAGAVSSAHIAFRLDTSGDGVERAPVEFEARRLAD